MLFQKNYTLELGKYVMNDKYVMITANTGGK